MLVITTTLGLLPHYVLAKLFEKVIHAQLTLYLNSVNYFSTRQFGFRKGHNTEHVLMAITDKAFHAIERNNVLVLVALDLRKAFTSVSRKLLLTKLAETAISPLIFNDYFTQRTQCVRGDNGSFSESIVNHWGVPEESVNGPILFSVFANKLPEVPCDSDSYLFADDTTLVRECTINNLRMTRDSCNLT